MSSSILLSQSERLVRKRDGRVVPFDVNRIIRAIALSFSDIRYGDRENAHAKDPSHLFGLDMTDYSKSVAIARRAENLLHARHFMNGTIPNIEQIQDTVEIAIMTEGEYEVAKNYVLYRARRNEQRLAHYDQTLMSEYVRTSKYMRFIPELQRRETLEEAVLRCMNMHMRRFSHLMNTEFRQDLVSAHTMIQDLRIWPSSRSMQFGGPAIEAHEARMFNCTYSPITRIEFFREYLYLLLCGCGCGFSVQWHHIDLLPELPPRPPSIDLPVKHFEIPDTIEGWSDAVHELFMSYIRGYHVEFNYSKIRGRGTPLKTSGGKAPGHVPLKIALTELDSILSQASGRKLKSIEAYDICMHLAQSVLAGGVRRSATICLFSSDDGEMMTAKSAQNYNPKTGPNKHRSASNNSAVILRSGSERAVFDKLFSYMKDFGEPGFYFVEDLEHGTNPCVEIGLNPRLVVDSNIDEVNEVLRSWEGDEVTVNGEPLSYIEHGDVLYGWQFCNLTTINGAKIRTEEDFYQACKAAALIGTLQASYTDIPYIGPISKYINDREALLGVSITGVMDSPKILLDPQVLRNGARIVIQENARVADIIGIEHAARTTCIKPEGTASKVLGAASGIHPHYARRYFRRIQANRNEAPLQLLKSINPEMVEPSIYGLGVDDVISFPVETPKDAIVRSDLTPTQFLDCVHLVMENWVKPGQANEDFSPGLHHNVSNTVEFRSADSKEVADWIWNHRFDVTGISLLVDPGVYPQSPYEEVVTDKQIEIWNRLECNLVNFTLLREHEDDTSLKETVACAGGACDWSTA